MQDHNHRAEFDTARLLLQHGWLSHAAQQCQAVDVRTPAGAGEKAEILSAIGRRAADPTTRNLSLEHMPVLVMRDTGTIISTLHLTDLEDPDLKRESFRQAVHYIDVETSSQCNRKCSYCPNSQNDRFTHNNFMDDGVYRSFVNDLAAIDYDKTLQFVGYSEPLLHIDDLMTRVRHARDRLPRAHLVVYTNGDFIETAAVDRIVAAGASEIKISVHLPVGQPYSDAAIFKRISKIAKRLSLPATPLDYAKDRHITARLEHPGIVITIYQVDYQQFGSNRASTLDDVGPKIDERTAACLMPFYQFILGHKGAVAPCCVMVTDDPRNAGYLMGQMPKSGSIFDVYGSRRFVQWRRSVFNLEPKQGPCAKCSWDTASPLLNAAPLYAPWQHLTRPPAALALSA